MPLNVLPTVLLSTMSSFCRMPTIVCIVGLQRCRPGCRLREADRAGGSPDDLKAAWGELGKPTTIGNALRAYKVHLKEIELRKQARKRKAGPGAGGVGPTLPGVGKPQAHRGGRGNHGTGGGAGS